MAGVTYLIRMIPAVFIRKKITNRFVISFLHYMPYAVLAVMTVPAIFYASGSVYSGVIGFAVGIVVAYFGGDLIKVALATCSATFIIDLIITIL
jgi:branched-subunit amino acid transport protein